MADLTGYSVSQFTAFPSGGRIQPTDRFFTSENISQTPVYADYLSKFLTYGELVERLFADLSTGMGFKSMAWESENDYSEAGHGHNFNVFDISARYDYKQQIGGQDPIVLASFKIGNKIVRLCMPKMWQYEYPKPEIGELKFLALNTIPRRQEININAPDFDGWVYPDGTSYAVSAADFISAKVYFSGDDAAGSTTLAVPSLSGFIKANPQKNSTADLVSFHNETSAHFHETEITIGGGSKEITLSADVTKSAGAEGTVHNGSNPYNPPKYIDATFVFTVNGNNIAIKGGSEIGNSDRNLDREQYPPFGYLPVMIYIGRKDQ